MFILNDIINNFFMPNRVIITEWVIIAVIVIFSIIVTRNMKTIPGKLQNIGEMAVGKLLDFLSGIIGVKTARRYFPLLGTCFIFIVVCNYCGELPGSGEGFTVPTTVLAVPAALGIIAFITIHTYGFRKKGFLGYLKSFLKPVAALLPLTLLEQFVRPLSMTLRLYGNMYGEERILDSLYEILPIGLPLIMHVLSLLFCLIQAMIFTMLLAIFIEEAIEEEEVHEKKPKKKKEKKNKQQAIN